MTKTIDNPVVACTLTSDEQQQRKTELRVTVLKHLVSTQEVDNGFKLIFNESPTLRDSLETLVKLENQCCGFLTFSISASGNGLSLSIEGPPEAKAAIQAFLDTLANVSC
ncbi:MAG: hypothetical protein PVJ39_10490 [Gammaproteobacteria bacterium]